MNNWTYKGQEIENLDDIREIVGDKEPFGFIYEVVHKPSGKKYLGRKQLIYKRKRKIGKRETKRLKEEKKEAGKKNWWIVKKYKYVNRESDWLEYLGSSDEIQELVEKDGIDAFERNILEFSFHKKQHNYIETRLLFERRVLENDEYLNSNIQGKYYPKDALDEIQ